MKAILLFLACTPVLWFLGHPGEIINGIDTNFPLDPVVWFLRRLFVWSNIPNAGSDFSASTAGLFFHFIQVFLYTFTNNLQLTELLSFIFWFSAIIFASYYFAKSFLKDSRAAVLLFVVLYSFNIYLFNTWENVKVANLSLTVAIPFGLGIIYRLWNKQMSTPRFVLLTTICGILSAGAGINPAYFFVFLTIITIFCITLFIREKSIQIFKYLLLFFVIIFVSNAYWILPSLQFIVSSIGFSGGLAQIGYANWIDSLSENTSLLNVMRLQGAWDWYETIPNTDTPYYIPYAHNFFYRFPFVLFSILIPVVAFFSLIFREFKKISWYIFFGILLLIGVFMGAGTHEPSGSVYRTLGKLPFFSLFRSPWYIFTPMVTLAYAGLLGLFWNRFYNKKAFQYLALVLIVCNLVYSYPLITGKIFRPAKEDRFYVKIPEYIFEAQQWISQNNLGRMLVYPPNEMEQFDWGYRGIETIVTLMNDQEVLFKPISNASLTTTQLINNLYGRVTTGNTEAINNLAYKLNATKLLIKNDQKGKYIAPAKVSLTNKLNTFGMWDVYQIGEHSEKVYATTQIFSVENPNHTTAAVPLLPREKTAISSSDSAVAPLESQGLITGHVVVSDSAHIETGAESFVNFSMNVAQEGNYSPVIPNLSPATFLNEMKNSVVMVNGKQQNWDVNRYTDSYIYYEPIYLESGSHSISVKLTQESIVHNFDFENNLMPSISRGVAKTEIKEETHNKYLHVFNTSDNPAYFQMLIPRISPLGVYELHFNYRQQEGSLPQVLGVQWSEVGTYRFIDNTLPRTPEWKHHSVRLESANVDSQIKFELLAYDSPNDNGSVTEFDNITVLQVPPEELFLIQETESSGGPTVTTKKISPVEYDVQVVNGNTPHVIVFSENYTPFWKAAIDNHKPLHFTANGFANAWFVENGDPEYTMKIYYAPQRLYTIGWYIFGVGMVLFVIYLVKHAKK